jgi:hypothetical protein
MHDTQVLPGCALRLCSLPPTPQVLNSTFDVAAAWIRPGTTLAALLQLEYHPLQAGAKTAPEVSVDPSVIQDVIIWSSHTFMQDHLALSPSSPGALQHQQAWEQQQQQASKASKAAAAAAAAESHARAPEGAGNGTNSSNAGQAGSLQAQAGGFDRAESLMDHLAADENLIQADEQQGNVSNGAAAQGGRDMQPPRAHSSDHDQQLEQVRQGLTEISLGLAYCFLHDWHESAIAVSVKWDV